MPGTVAECRASCNGLETVEGASNLDRHTPTGFNGIAYRVFKGFGQSLASGKRNATEDEQCAALVLRLGGKQQSSEYFDSCPAAGEG